MYCAFVVIQLKDSIETNLQEMTLGSGFGYHPIGYLKDDNFGYHALSISFQLCQADFLLSRWPSSCATTQVAVWFSLWITTTNSSYFFVAKDCHQLVASRFRKAFDTSSYEPFVSFVILGMLEEKDDIIDIKPCKDLVLLWQLMCKARNRHKQPRTWYRTNN